MNLDAGASWTPTLQGKAEMEILRVMAQELGEVCSGMKLSVQYQGGLVPLLPKPSTGADPAALAVPSTPPITLDGSSPYGVFLCGCDSPSRCHGTAVDVVYRATLYGVHRAVPGFRAALPELSSIKHAGDASCITTEACCVEKQGRRPEHESISRRVWCRTQPARPHPSCGGQDAY